MVRGDQAVNYGKVVHAMTVLQAAGAPSVGLMTESPPGKK
jgi:biopolymer transport protein TolR